MHASMCACPPHRAQAHIHPRLPQAQIDTGIVVRQLSADALSATVSICRPSIAMETADMCSDGLDNDCDGLIDGQDPDCASDDEQGKGPLEGMGVGVKT